MNPGKRDHKITIERPASTPDGMGGRSKTWEIVCTAWAEFGKPRTQTASVQGGVAAVVTQEITIPRNDNVTIGHTVRDGVRSYKIIGLGTNDRRYTTLICEEVIRHAG